MVEGLTNGILERKEKTSSNFENDLAINFVDYREKWCLHFMFLDRMQIELGKTIYGIHKNKILVYFNNFYGPFLYTYSHKFPR